MNKNLVATALGLACALSFSNAEACNWTGQRAGLIGSGAVVGTLVAGPVGTVIGVALGDWLNSKSDACHAGANSTSAALDVVPVSTKSYANLKHFDTNGETAVYFSVGSNTLNKTDQSLLSSAASVLKAHPKFDLAIVGAADPTGQERGYDNLGLSKRRADSVKTYLHSYKGIDANRLLTKGIGAILSSEKKEFDRLRVAKLKLVQKKHQPKQL